MCFAADKVRPRMRAWARRGLYLLLIVSSAVRLGGGGGMEYPGAALLPCMYRSAVTTVRLGEAEDAPTAAGQQNMLL